nr:RNA-dependent RNA polymerase [buhirugu virus 6]
MRSVVLGVSLVASGYVLWRERQRIVAVMAIGPYPTSLVSPIPRVLQRALVDKTKKDVSFNWFPHNFVPTTFQRRVSDNGHPISGAVRDAARVLISDAVDSAGLKRFEISPASKTSALCRAVHQHYAPGDLHMDVKNQQPLEGEVIICVDTDYYLRDVSEVFGFVNPIILHTFSPLKVAGIDGDCPYTISNNEVRYHVSGGAAWSHQVWDWVGYGEYLEIDHNINSLWKWIMSCLGVRKTIMTKVHHIRPWVDCPDRALVWCIPQYTYWRFTWFNTDLHARKLQRIRFQDQSRPGWNSLVYLDKENKQWISLGREGEDATVELPKIDFDVLMGLQSSQSVTSRMIGMKYTSPHELAMVGQYYRKGTAEDPGSFRIGRPASVRVHWPEACEADFPESSSRAYSTPVVTDENLMPMIKRWEALSLSLERRVEFVKNNKIPPKKFQSYAEEFLRCVVPTQGEGVPYSLEETATLLDKPSQVLAVQQIWETVDMPVRRLIECFLKNEPCNKPGRIISAFADARYLLQLSAITLAFRDQVLHAEHNQHWFCPGLTPTQIADKLCEYVSAVDQVAEGDYSNLDGTVSVWLQRRVMNASYLRWCAPKFRAEATELLDMLVTCPARAKRFGFSYDAGHGVKSGSPTTCDANTLAGGFVQYCAVRETQPELAPLEAFRAIGLAFGDDGLFDRRYKRCWTKSAERLGLSLKIEPYQPEQGVCFLARVFPDPWNSRSSFQDPLRTWRKLHLTARDPTIPLATAAVDRLEGYLVTDALTPVTSDYCRMILRTLGRDAERLEVRRSRKTVDREKPYWLTIGGSWPQDVRDVPNMWKCISERTGFDEALLRDWVAKVNNLDNHWALPSLNRDDEPNPYKDTLDLDAQPCAGEVDQRIFLSDQHVQRSRAHQTTARKFGASMPASNGSDQKDGVANRQLHGKRSRRLPSVRPQRQGEGEEGHRGLARQTPGGGGNSKGSKQARAIPQMAEGNAYLRRLRPRPNGSSRMTAGPAAAGANGVGV